MSIERLLSSAGVKYRLHRINGNVSYVEFENEFLIIIIKSKDNVFKIKRKDFYVIDDLLLPYVFLLIDERDEKKYLIKVSEPANFVRNAFDNTSKDEIFFGKQVLQKKINDITLIDEIKKIGGAKKWLK